MNTIQTNGIELSVTVNGKSTRIYPHEGKFFLESREGSEYSIEIKNTTWNRVEAVIAVDGLSVMNGKSASKTDSGYLINAYDKIIIKGFRKDLTEVGAFKFTKKESSYAAGKGDSSNVGVIAVAVYREKYRPILWGSLVPTSVTWTAPANPWWGINTCTDTSKTYTSNIGPTFTTTGGSCDSVDNSAATNYHASNEKVRGGTMRSAKGLRGNNGPQGCAGAATKSAPPPIQAMQCCVGTSSLKSDDVGFEHGTTWGQKIQDKVVHVEFERDTLIATTEIFYNSKSNLEAMGIKTVQEKQVTLPRGFPNDFAEPPKNWHG